jgi:hypothetical protein
MIRIEYYTDLVRYNPPLQTFDTLQVPSVPVDVTCEEKDLQSSVHLVGQCAKSDVADLITTEPFLVEEGSTRSSPRGVIPAVGAAATY